MSSVVTCPKSDSACPHRASSQFYWAFRTHSLKTAVELLFTMTISSAFCLKISSLSLIFVDWHYLSLIVGPTPYSVALFKRNSVMTSPPLCKRPAVSPCGSARTEASSSRDQVDQLSRQVALNSSLIQSANTGKAIQIDQVVSVELLGTQAWPTLTHHPPPPISSCFHYSHVGAE